MIVTTLPVCYRKNRSFKVLFPAFMAKCASRLTRSHLVLPLNLMGTRNSIAPVEYEAIRKAYGEEASLLGFDVPLEDIFSDMDDEFRAFISRRITEGLDKGRLARTVQAIIHCDCGKIELATQAFRELQAQGRLRLASSKGGAPACVLCGSGLRTDTAETLVHRFGDQTASISVFPASYAARAKSTMAQATEHQVILSRHFRTAEGSLPFEDGTVIDPDYCWGHYLAFLRWKYGVSEFIMAVGVDYLAEACRTAALTRDMDPGIGISLLIHPLVRIAGEGAVANDMRTADFGRACRSGAAAQLFLSLGIQWSRFDSKIPASELELVQLSLEGKTIPLVSGEGARFEPAEITHYLKRDNVLKILKALRQRSELTERDRAIVRAIIT